MECCILRIERIGRFFTGNRPCLQGSVGRVLDDLGVRSINIGWCRRVAIIGPDDCESRIDPISHVPITYA
jgi:hypothetical protein